MRLERAASIEDLRTLARKRLPRFVFDFIDGGAEDEVNLRKNREAFEAAELCPRYLVDVSETSTETEMFGKTYSVPFGVAPVGFLNMAWPETDLAMARLAAQKQMPLVISTASSTSLEEIASAAGGCAWFQMYIPKSENLADELLDRVEKAGMEVLIVTIDVSQAGKRDRDIRNGLQIPFKFTPEIVAQLAMHPHWSLATLRSGIPGYGNFERGNQALSLVEVQQQIISPGFTWQGLKTLRKKWPHKLLLKGILHPNDAEMAAEAGCDGIIVSNHGGRQVDQAPSSLAALANISNKVKSDFPVLLDSGVRRGADAIRAKALGASYVFAGRAFAYGAAAGGEHGCARAFEILELELQRALGQIGCPDFGEVGPGVLAPGQHV